MQRKILLVVVMAATFAAGAGPRRRAVQHPGAPQRIHVAVFTHNEDPHHPETPDFVRDKPSYDAFRAALLVFADFLRSKNVSWNWQSDWNFLNAVILYEIEAPDAGLLAATNGKNVVRYLKEDLGVEIDPHSHENDGYNYADVAYLVQRCGVTPSPVVGGHIYDPAVPAFQNWPRFNNGINGSRTISYFWKPSLLMGAGTPNHARDPAVSGLWRPKSAQEFFATGGNGIAAFGNWRGNIVALDDLVDRMRSGQLPAGAMWTAAIGFNQSDMVKPGFLESTMAPVIDRLIAHRDAGAIRLVQFEEALRIWRETYGEAENVYR